MKKTYLLFAGLFVVVTAGCEGFRLEAVCGDGSSPDFESDIRHCGVCFNSCLRPNLRAACIEGGCQFSTCEPEWADFDDDPSNGCECRLDPDVEGSCTARLCRENELHHNNYDDDCDGEVDEYSTLESRAHCGAAHRSCLLSPGSANVDCVDGACIPQGDATFEPAREGCWDAVDEDGNGIRDDGPLCEVLLPNRARLDCEAEGARCDPTVFPMGHSGNGNDRAAEYPMHHVTLSHDIVIDRYEATRGQFASFLRAEGRCEGQDADRRCDVAEDARYLPAGEVNWCEAYDYCRWMGKRLPTEAEWVRLAGGTTAGWNASRPYPFSGQPRIWAPADGAGIPPASILLESADETCEHGGPVVRACYPDPDERPKPVSFTAGRRLVGDLGPDCRDPQESLEPLTPEEVCRDRKASAAVHVAGNVWEWTFDQFQGYCERLERQLDVDRQTLPPDARAAFNPNCRDALENVELAAQRREPILLTDPLFDSGPRRSERVLRGGGTEGELQSSRFFNRVSARPGTGSNSYGVRCARTFDPDAPEDSLAIPYDSTKPSGDWASCEATPELADAVAQPIRRLAGFCVPTLTETEDVGYGDAVEITVRREIIPPGPAFILAREDGDRLSIGHADVEAGVWRWLRDGEVAIGAPDCSERDCRTVFSPPSNIISIWWSAANSHQLRFEIQWIERRPRDEARCTWPANQAGERWVAGVALLADSPLTFNDQELSFVFCDNFDLECSVEGFEDRLACRQCPSWPMEFELLFEPIE